MGESLDFADLREQNVSRAKRWHPGFPDDSEWSGGDWGNAMAGEAGEACNIVKKLRRLECGLVGKPGENDAESLIVDLAKELADLVTYADLLAAKYAIDLAEAVAAKFNRVSAAQGFPERLQADQRRDRIVRAAEAMVDADDPKFFETPAKAAVRAAVKALHESSS